MNSPISCGIIGCGVIAPMHAKCYQQIDGVTVRWACDLELDKAKALADTFDIPKQTVDYRDLLQDPEVDVISICTDHASHAQIVIDAVRHGKHVLCEKALTAHTEDLDAVLEEVRKHPELICGGIFQHRFNSKNRYLKGLVEDGFFGTLLSASLQVHCYRADDYYKADPWRGTLDLEGGGVLINQAIHFVDAMVFAVGPVAEVSAIVENRTHGDVIEVEDTVVATLRFANGTLGTLEATSSSEHQKWFNRLVVTGSDAMVELCNESLTNLTCMSEDSAQNVREGFESKEENRPLMEGKSYYGSGHSGQIQDFIEAVRSGSSPEVTLENASHAVRVVHAIYKASQSGRWESVAR